MLGLQNQRKEERKFVDPIQRCREGESESTISAVDTRQILMLCRDHGWGKNSAIDDQQSAQDLTRWMCECLQCNNYKVRNTCYYKTNVEQEHDAEDVRQDRTIIQEKEHGKKVLRLPFCGDRMEATVEGLIREAFQASTDVNQCLVADRSADSGYAVCDVPFMHTKQICNAPDVLLIAMKRGDQSVYDSFVCVRVCFWVSA